MMLRWKSRPRGAEGDEAEPAYARDAASPATAEKGIYAASRPSYCLSFPMRPIIRPAADGSLA